MHREQNPVAVAHRIIGFFPRNIADFSSRSKVDLWAANDPQARFHRWVSRFTIYHCLNVEAAESIFAEGWDLMWHLIFGRRMNLRVELTESVMFEQGAFGWTFAEGEGFTAVQVSPTLRLSDGGRLYRRHLSTVFILATMLHEACHAVIRELGCSCKECEEDSSRCGGHVEGWAILARAVEERARKVLGLEVDLEVEFEMERSRSRA